MLFHENTSLLAHILELILKSIIVAAVVLSVVWAKRRASAAERHLYLSMAVAALLLLPLASIILPSWHGGLLPNPFSASEEISQIETGQLEVDTPRSDLESRSTVPGKTGSDHLESSTDQYALGINLYQWLLLVWGIGGGILLIRLLGGKLYGYWIAHHAPAVEHEQILSSVKLVSEQLGLMKRIPVFQSDHLKVPFVTGLFRPKLILPSQTEGWPFKRIEAVLHHEFAHIKRGDVLIQFFAQLACCLYWVNPLVWVMERKLFIERERACDDIAINQGIKVSEYAEHLMDVMEDLEDRKAYVWVMSAMAEGTDFKDRIISVLDPVAKRSTPRFSHLITVVMFSLLLILPLASLYPWANSDTKAGINVDGGMAIEGVSGDLGEHSAVGKNAASRKTTTDEQTSALIALLESPDANMREHAATALGKIGDGKAIPALVKTISTDASSRVREHAAEALGRIGNKKALSALIEVVENDPEARVREHAASAIGRVGGEGAYDTLVDVYENDANIGVRAHGAYGLGLLKDSRAFDLLVEGLSSRHPQIRSHCAEALGFLGNERADKHLRKLQNDNSRQVRESAVRAREMLKGKR
jgi:beta-lactamase regulating signal transducer with metallopeptidase domain